MAKIRWLVNRQAGALLLEGRFILFSAFLLAFLPYFIQQRVILSSLAWIKERGAVG